MRHFIHFITQHAICIQVCIHIFQCAHIVCILFTHHLGIRCRSHFESCCAHNNQSCSYRTWWDCVNPIPLYLGRSVHNWLLLVHVHGQRYRSVQLDRLRRFHTAMLCHDSWSYGIQNLWPRCTHVGNAIEMMPAQCVEWIAVECVALSQSAWMSPRRNGKWVAVAHIHRNHHRIDYLSNCHSPYQRRDDKESRTVGMQHPDEHVHRNTCEMHW